MIYRPTISKYLFLLFLRKFLLVALVVGVILLLSNIFDSIQKFKTNSISMIYFWQFVFLKLPYLFSEILPLTSFMATLLFLHYIYVRQEFVILLVNGVSIWQLIIVPLLAVFLIGILCTTICAPIGAHGFRKYYQLEEKLDKSAHHNFIVANNGIFFFEKYEGSNRIIQAKSIDLANNVLSNVVILLVDDGNKPVKRIDASSARLKGGKFFMEDVKIFTEDMSESLVEFIMPTDLSPKILFNRFNKPEMVSLWSLNKVITNFNKLGLPTISYQGYFYKQLLKSLSMLAMAMLAFIFIATNHLRKQSSSKRLLIGSMTGCLFYLVTEILSRFLLFSGILPIVAVVLPILLIMLISNFVILHFQEA